MGHQSERQEWPVDEDEDEDEDLMGRGGRPGGEGLVKQSNHQTRPLEHGSTTAVSLGGGGFTNRALDGGLGGAKGEHVIACQAP
ncbi:hypothetical protein E5D57_007533 [Metarhizium anisopliae]|nr:hypothetical protein E5D57_007533 [Metarhizium anisopliae]